MCRLHYCVVTEGDEFLLFTTLADGRPPSFDEAVSGRAIHRGSVRAARARVHRALGGVADALAFCHARGVLHQDVKQARASSRRRGRRG